MRDVIGLNKASDASQPDKDSLVGLQKLAALNSNTATRHILEGVNYITRLMAEAVQYRVSDLIKFTEFKEDFIRKIGQHFVGDMQKISDFHLRDYAIYLDLSLDEEERAKLEADLSFEIQKGTINTEDKWRILNIKNLKYATLYLALLRKRNQRRMEEAKKREYDYQADANIRAAQAAEQAKQQTEQMVINLKTQLEAIKGQNEINKEIERGRQNRLTTEFEHPYKMDQLS